MALIKCEECGNQISDKAERCPKCGKSVDHSDNELTGISKKIQGNKIFSVGIGLIAALISLAGLIAKMIHKEIVTDVIQKNILNQTSANLPPEATILMLISVFCLGGSTSLLVIKHNKSSWWLLIGLLGLHHLLGFYIAGMIMQFSLTRMGKENS